jgi:diguanylate cyclase (GGDEF)-like protein
MHISRVINSCCRSSELCARWGGEEFVVLLPEADSDSAVALAERIRATLEATPLRTPNQEILITISVGGTELCPGDSPEEIFRRADQQLLRAKESGRNTVFFDRNESQNRHEAELNETRDSSGLTTK